MSLNQEERLQALVTFADNAASTAFFLAQGTKVKLTAATLELKESQEQYDAEYESRDSTRKESLANAVKTAEAKVVTLQKTLEEQSDDCITKETRLMNAKSQQETKETKKWSVLPKMKPYLPLKCPELIDRKLSITPKHMSDSFVQENLLFKSNPELLEEYVDVKKKLFILGFWQYSNW